MVILLITKVSSIANTNTKFHIATLYDQLDFDTLAIFLYSLEMAYSLKVTT